MKLTSMHTHTVFCDGKDDIETMCRVAYEKKLYAVGFSAHAPVSDQIGIQTDWHLSRERAGEYISEVIAAKRRWHGKLNVFLGLEVDYIKGLRSPLDKDIKEMGLDYIIGAVNYVIPPNGGEIFTVDAPLEEFNKCFNESFGGDGEALMNYYYDAMAEMITMGGFDILAHSDLIKKNCQGTKYWSEYNEALRQKEIAEFSAKAKITAEINTGGLNRNKINECYPSLSFLRYFRENNVPVTITSDAHCADHINGNYDNALQTLINADFKEYVIFCGKNNGKAVWQTEKINKF
jgi:histidinol-phosphatase (PHP family)